MIKRTLLLFALIISFVTANAAYVQLKYRGTVGPYAVEVAFNYNTGGADTNYRPYFTDDGYYRYASHSDRRIRLATSNCDASKSTWTFNEYSGGQRTGRWTLKSTRDGFTGTFVTTAGKKYNVKLYNVTGERDWEWAW